VRIARTHPGASPSAAMPDGTWQFFRTLLSMAAGREGSPAITIGRSR
jgi:hypothetical protein